MPEGDLTDEQAAALVPRPAPLLPTTQSAIAGELGASAMQSAVNVPPVIGDTRRRQESLGERPGVPFHEEGLPGWADLMAKSQENAEEQVKYLARTFGAQNVRLNEYNEPVVSIKNEDTGQMEDYPLNPRQLTVRSLTSLARFAPDVAMGIVGYAMGGPRGAAKPAAGVATKMGGMELFKRSLGAAIGSELGGAGREILGGAGSRLVSQGPGAVLETPLKDPLERAAIDVPFDMLADLGLVGGVKAAQIVRNIGLPKWAGGAGIQIPNPIGGTALTQPARPRLTSEGVAAARRVQAASGIDPMLRGSEISGIPVHAMIEQYLERTASGASPQIAASEARENASKALQNWLVDPSTLGTDEQIAKKMLRAVKTTVEPVEKDVELAKFALEAEERGMKRLGEAQTEAARAAARTKLEATQAAGAQSASLKIAQDLNADLPRLAREGIDLGPTGNALRQGYLARREAFFAENKRLYGVLDEMPKYNESIIDANTLKGDIDELRKQLPFVRKEVEEEIEGVSGNLITPTGEIATKTAVRNVPIATPIRPRLDEWSAKLKDGTVSLNTLKGMRTDLDEAIKQGEAIPGVKPGRLKRTYKLVSDAIDRGLKEIDDPALTKAWDDATQHYSKNVDQFLGKDVAVLAKEADQFGSVGNEAFAKRAISSPDHYTALKSFYGAASPEIATLHNAVRNKVLSDSLGADRLIDGPSLVRQLKSTLDNNPTLFKEALGGKGMDLLRAAEQLGSFQQKIPMSEIEKMLAPGASPGKLSISAKLIALQSAQKRLDQEYAIGPIKDYLTGKIPLSDLSPDRLIGGMKNYKLSDVQEVMARVAREDPATLQQYHRKAVQQLLLEARRTGTPTDALAKTFGENGELLSATGIVNAIGRGEQREKYKAMLGPLFDTLMDLTRVELLGEERRNVAGQVGLLVPGSIVGQLRKALTPWEGHEKGKGILMELGGLARDKVFSIMVSSPAIQRWLMSPYALKDADRAMRAVILSQPFIEGMIDEFKDKDALSQTMSALKVAFGTASEPEAAPQAGALTQSEAERLVPRPSVPIPTR